MLLTVVLLLLLSLAFSQEVPHITAEDFREYFKESPILVVYLYDFKVDRYKRGLKKFSNIVMDLKYDIQPKYMALNCADNHTPCERNFWTERPAVLILKKGSPVEKFTGSLDSYGFRSFLRSHLSLKATSVNSPQFRILLLIVILIALVLIFLKTIRSTYGESIKSDLEEQAPLVSRSAEHNVE